MFGKILAIIYFIFPYTAADFHIKSVNIDIGTLLFKVFEFADMFLCGIFGSGILSNEICSNIVLSNFLICILGILYYSFIGLMLGLLFTGAKSLFKRIINSK